MAVEFTQEVSSRLESDQYGWLTTVAKSGQPVPRLVWFHFDGKDLVVYSMPARRRSDTSSLIRG
jgi:PPOX class probable F420-dependent enzyme